MEIAFAFLFAVAAIVAVWALTLLSVEKERRRRSDDEVAALRVLSRGSLSTSESSPGLLAVDGDASREAPARSAQGPDADQWRAALDRARPAIALARELGTGGGASDEARERAVAETAAALRELLAAATRMEEEVAALLGEAAEVQRKLEVREGAPTWPTLTSPPPASPSLSVAARHGEQMADQGQRLRALLVTSSLQATRLSASMRALEKTSKALGLRAESLGPLAASLSGLADRVNLLALHAAFEEPGNDTSFRPDGPGVGASGAAAIAPARAGERGGVTAAELRAIYEEMRGLSRELLAAAQTGQDGSVSVAESLGVALQLTETVQSAAGRVVDRLVPLEAASQALLESLGAAQRLVSEAEELQRALGRRVAAAAERESAAVRSVEERTEHVTALASRLEKVLSSLRDLRQPANRALGGLEEVRASSPGAAAGLEPALGELASALAELERAATSPSSSPSP